MYSPVELPFCGPCIFVRAFPLDGETRFFIYFGEKYDFFLENTWSRHLFLKGKQNKKENPKCDSLFGKCGLWKTKSGFEG